MSPSLRYRLDNRWRRGARLRRWVVYVSATAFARVVGGHDAHRA